MTGLLDRRAAGLCLFSGLGTDVPGTGFAEIYSFLPTKPQSSTFSSFGSVTRSGIMEIHKILKMHEYNATYKWGK